MINLKIKIVRLLKKFSQGDVAEILNSSQTYITLKESGKRSITTKELSLIASALKTPAEVFFYSNSRFLRYLLQNYHRRQIKKVFYENLEISPFSFKHLNDEENIPPEDAA